MTKITTTLNKVIPSKGTFLSQNFLPLLFLSSLTLGLSFQTLVYADMDTPTDDLKPKDKVSVNTPATDTTDENNGPQINRSMKLELPKSAPVGESTAKKAKGDKDSQKD